MSLHNGNPHAESATFSAIQRQAPLAVAATRRNPWNVGKPVAIASQIALHGRLRVRQWIVAMLLPEVAHRLASIITLFRENRDAAANSPRIRRLSQPVAPAASFGAAVSLARYSLDTWRPPLKEKTFSARSKSLILRADGSDGAFDEPTASGISSVILLIWRNVKHATLRLRAA